MTRFNKASAAAVSGALVTLAGAFVALDGELQGAAQTLLTALLVYLVPNKEA